MRILLLTLVLSTPLLHAEPEVKGTPSELTQYLNGIPRIVTITGESEIKTQADRATITLRIVTEDRSLEQSLRANQILRSRLNLLMTQAGIPQEGIIAGKFASTPKSGAFSDKARSYKVENSIKVNVADEKQFNAVAKLVDANAEVYYAGVEFEYSNKAALKLKGLKEANEDVLARKKIFEQTLDVTLVPKRFTETQQVPKEQTYPSAERDMESKISSGYASSTAVTTHSFGEMVFKTTIAVEYAVISESELPPPGTPGVRAIPTRTLRVPPIEEPTQPVPALK